MSRLKEYHKMTKVKCDFLFLIFGWNSKPNNIKSLWAMKFWSGKFHEKDRKMLNLMVCSKVICDMLYKLL